MKLLPLFILLTSSLFAQTAHNFTFGTFSSPGCAEFQGSDGTSGAVCVPYGENPWWGISAPQSWGLPNNGFLTNNTTTPQLGAPVFSVQGCNLKMAGCVDTQTATADFTGYGSGVTLEVTIWSTVNKHTHFGRGCYPCVYYTNDETNGTGVATY